MQNNCLKSNTYELPAQQPAFDPLAAGETITTGTLTAALPITVGEMWQSRYDGLPGMDGLTLRFVA